MGSIRQVTCHPSKPYAATVGLDSYLRIYDINTAQLLHQVYLKVSLNTVLMRSNFGDVEDEEDKQEKGKEEEDKDSDIECVTLSDDEYDDMFNNMETVVDEPSSKKRKK